jgi:hypothetical protein
MSVDNNGIGTVGREGFSVFDWKSWVNTYGRWAGPGWSGGIRTDNATPLAGVEPSKNNKTNPLTGKPVNSELDAAARIHDLNYEKYSDPNMTILKADQILVTSLEANLKPTIMDSTELEYAKDAITWFNFQIKYLDEKPAPTTTSENIKNAAAQAWCFADGSGGARTIGDDVHISAKVDGDYISVDKLTLDLNGQTATGSESDSLIANFIAEYGKGRTSFKELIIGFAQANNSADRLIGSNGDDLIYAEAGVDIISAGSGNDLIYGGDGADKFVGGTGNDTIYGGEGNDVYIVNGGDGTDTIEDKQGNNKVILCGKEIKALIPQANGTYKNQDGTLLAVLQGTDLVVTDVSGTQVILNEDFQWGDFGINLVTLPTNPTAGNTITGDLTPVDFDPATEGIQEHYDEWGNVIVDPTKPDPGRADKIYDTFGNDQIVGGAGDDVINTARGGDDWIKGGDGDDQLTLGAGNDHIDGVGGDVIHMKDKLKYRDARLCVSISVRENIRRAA